MPILFRMPEQVLRQESHADDREPRGGFPGMNVNRVFKVVVVTPDQAIGLEPATKNSELRYNGSKISLRL